MILVGDTKYRFRVYLFCKILFEEFAYDFSVTVSK